MVPLRGGEQACGKSHTLTAEESGGREAYGGHCWSLAEGEGGPKLREDWTCLLNEALLGSLSSLGPQLVPRVQIVLQTS